MTKRGQNGGLAAAVVSTSFKSAMKWMGIVAAILSFSVGVQQFVSQRAESEERERRIAELMTMGAAQQLAKDYPQAWISFEAALAQAEQGNFLAKLTRRLGAQREQVRHAQEDLAMRWLENVSVPEGTGFASVVDPLLPILHRGVVTAAPSRIGDLYAHIGWGYFLKQRDGNRALDPAPWYTQALQADKANPYAHAYLGHWLLWNRQPLDKAMQEFAAALASNRERSFVRNLQRSALVNLRTPEAELQLIKIVDDMRQQGEPVDASLTRAVRSVYTSATRDKDLAKQVLAVLPPQDHLATLTLLRKEAPDDPALQIMAAQVWEATGRRDDALTAWRAVRALFPAKSENQFAKRADEAIKTLSK